MLATIHSVQRHSPASIVCAAPVASAIGVRAVVAAGVTVLAPYIHDVPVFLTDSYYGDFADVPIADVRHVMTILGAT
jgi:predicted phosphoribosyltransferase